MCFQYADTLVTVCLEERMPAVIAIAAVKGALKFVFLDHLFNLTSSGFH